MTSRIRIVLEMIKFEHSVFALPFALTGALLGARATHHGWPTLRQLTWVVVAMVAARSAAMTVNRIVDLRYDAKIPAPNSAPSPPALFRFPSRGPSRSSRSPSSFLAAWQLNTLALKLAPLAMAILFFYSFTKRFTTWSHLFLGFALGISPAAAWIAITGSFDPRMLILCAAVTLWVGGFDVLYACQDIDFDRNARPLLHSAAFRHRQRPVDRSSYARRRGALLVWLAASFALPWPAWLGIVVVAALLAYEHSLVKADDLSKLDAAFFAMNGYISMSFLLFWGAAVALWRI